MSMLARYKKNSASMMELVKLIEESAEPKKSNLINMVTKEDPEFGERITRRLFTYEKLKELDEGIIAEIVSANTAKILALSIYGDPDEAFCKLVERCLGNKFSEFREEKENAASVPPNEGQIASARRKMVSEARKLEADGAIKLMDYDQIDASIGGGGSTSANSEALGGEDGPTGDASESDGLPPIDSFGIQLPPAGLLGERFEAYVKKTLGLK